MSAIAMSELSPKLATAPSNGKAKKNVTFDTVIGLQLQALKRKVVVWETTHPRVLRCYIYQEGYLES